jgi:SAM-dependent methyltransferase
LQPSVPDRRELHHDRARACSFGLDAEGYDRARPSYPRALVDDLLAERPRRVLDVGCGTGKASRLFRDRGCDVLGVEPDYAMAAVASGYGIPVEVESFERWDPRGRRFELVVSAQAWHWIEPEAGLAKVATLLLPGGRFAAFWNLGSYEPPVRDALLAVYERLAPTLVDGSAVGGTAAMLGMCGTEGPGADDIAALESSGLFRDAELHVYEWRAVYRKSEWLATLPTYSDHRLLPVAQLDGLLEAVGEAIDALGGQITLVFETTVVTARRS